MVISDIEFEALEVGAIFGFISGYIACMIMFWTIFWLL